MFKETLCRICCLFSLVWLMSGCIPAPNINCDLTTQKVGFEILEIQSINSIRAWISPDIDCEEYTELQLPLGWLKNQVREGDPDESHFHRSPNATNDGEYLDEDLYGFQWRHSATVIKSNISLDEQGLLVGSIVRKFHEVTFHTGSKVFVLISPEGDSFVRISRDANRLTDQPTIPDFWQLLEHTLEEQIVIQLPYETTVIRADNEDSFQGPVQELTFLNE